MRRQWLTDPVFRDSRDPGPLDAQIPIPAYPRGMRIRSGLGRRLDPSPKSNVIVVVGTPLAGIAAGSWRLLTGTPLGDAVWGGILGGGAAFLAWAVGRELDPDRPLTATLALLVAPWVLLAGDPALLGAAIVLLGLRITAGTTGYPLYWADAVALVLFAFGSGTGGAGPIPGALAGLAVLVFDRRAGRVAGPLVAAASFGGWALWGEGPSWVDLAGGEWVLTLAAAPALAGVVWPRATVPTDRGDTAVRSGRVGAARVLALASVAAAVGWLGAPGLVALSPALIGAGAAGFPAGRGRGADGPSST